MSMKKNSTSAQYGIAIGSVVCASVIFYPLTNFVGYQAISLLLLFVVALLSLFVNIGAVLSAAAISALIWNYFFIPPHYTFAIGLPQDALMFLTYFVIAAVTGILNSRIRTRRKHASALFAFTKNLLTVQTPDEAAEIAVRHISTFFNAEVAIFLGTPDGDIFTQAHPTSTLAVDKKEFGIAAWVYWNEKKAGKFTETFMPALATYYPISGPRYPLGVIGIRPKTDQAFTVDQESLLQNFIAQIASTLEREQLNELTKRTVIFAESEKLYKTLFNSISHELRTPIAAIVSASEAMRAHMPNDAHQKEFVNEIHTAAERLNRLVENLLDMTRLESGQLAPKLDWCDVRDIINASIKKLEEELSHHTVQIDIPENVPLVKLDFGLIEQSITNVLHNASQYTPAETIVHIAVQKNDGELTITIRDNGPGFPSDAQKKLFEKFYRVPGTKAGGTGLGLSIAKGFIEAHKGTIAVSNHPLGGALFEIRIPIHN